MSISGTSTRSWRSWHPREHCAGDPDERFEIGSITKVFMGLLLAVLADDGIVELTDPVTTGERWVREPRWAWTPSTTSALSSWATTVAEQLLPPTQFYVA